MNIFALFKKGLEEIIAFIAGIVLTFWWFSSGSGPSSKEFDKKDSNIKEDIKKSKSNIKESQFNKKKLEGELSTLEEEEKRLKKQKKKSKNMEDIKKDLSNFFENRK